MNNQKITEESRIPLPGDQPWPSASEQRAYWEQREKTEYQLLAGVQKKLNQLDALVFKMLDEAKNLDAVVLKMMDDIEGLRKLIERTDKTDD